jgi:hypothetical protein
VTYEISFLRPDGRCSLIWKAHCPNDLDATVKAAQMMRPEFARVEIRHDGRAVSLANLVPRV